MRATSIQLACFVAISLTLSMCQVQEDHTEVLPRTRDPIVFHPTLELDSHMSEDDKWIYAGDLATLSATKKISAVNVPININLIFVGFDADGNQGIHLTRHDFEPWFDHLEHVIRHRIVPLDEETLTTDRQSTPQRPITYSVTTRVIRVSPLVNSILEDAIYWHLRPEDPDVDKHQDRADTEHRDYYYVDALKFAGVLKSLLEELKLDTTYTLFVLNPKSPVDADQGYGYRSGFSARELELLRGNYDIAEGSFSEFYYRAKEGHQDSAKPVDRLTTQLGDNNAAVYWYDLSRDSEAWAKNYLANSIKGYYKECTADEDSNCGFDSRKREGDIVAVAREISKLGTEYQKAYLYLAQNYEMSSNCLVDTWLSGGRFGFVDLTAGPVTWSPSITGEGSKTGNSKPTVPHLVHAEHHANEEFGTVDEDSDDESDDQIRKSSAEYLQTIAKKYEQYCRDNEQQGEFNLLCAVWRTALDNSHMSVQDLIGEVHEGDHSETVTDQFLSKLGAFVSHAYQHVFVPPSPMFDTSFSERVVFDFYVVADHKAYEPLDSMHFNVKEFKHELFKFKLPNQEFTFKLRDMTEESAQVVWSAIRSATRHAQVPRLDHAGQFVLDAVSYIDAQLLQLMIEDLLKLNMNDDESRDQVMRHIPILLISTNSSLAIDKRHLARALHSMILIVQTPAPPTPYVLCRPYALDHYLARAPLGQALAATALRLGGLMSPHIGYLPGRARATQDWTWSVGDSPVSLTSITGHHFSTLQRDIVHRNWVVNALSSAVQSLNLAVDTLKSLHTMKGNLKGQALLPLLDLSLAYNESCRHIAEITAAVDRLDFERATTLLRPLRAAVQRFKRATVTCEEEMNALKCQQLTDGTADTSASDDWLTPLIVLLDVLLLLVLVFFVKRPKRKLKIN